MRTNRFSLLRAPLVAVVTFLLALLALYPGASLRGQQAPERVPDRALERSRAESPLGGVDGEVADLVLKGKHLEVTYRNIGTVATPIIGELQVLDADGTVVEAVAFVDGRRIDAGKTERFKVAMPALSPGRYTLYAVVQFGGPALAAAQADLEVMPPASPTGRAP